MILNSIRHRLLLILLAVISLVGAVTLVSSYREARHEVQELFDAQLAQSARVLLSILLTRTEHEDFTTIQSFLDAVARVPAVAQTSAQDEELIELHDYERKISFQLWDKNGRLLLHSANLRNRALSPVGLHPDNHGFHDETLEQQHWRTFSLWDDNSGYLIQVGEQYAIRDELSSEIIWQLLMPSLISIPFIGILIWWAVSRALLPLYRITNAIAMRNPDNLDVVDSSNVPDEIMPLVHELNNLFAALRKAFERERRFTDDAAHELRTPLAALKTQAQVALRAQTDEDRTEALRSLIQGVDRATRLLNQMLTLARLDNRRGPNSVQVELVTLVRHILSQLSDRAVLKNIELDYVGPEQITANLEAVSVEILLRNLIENAVNYTPRNGQVTVSITQENKRIIIGVCDTGPGIDPELYERVFERYYRGLGHEYNGSGLGLAIVKQCAEVLAARLELKTPPGGKGLLVEVVLPASSSVLS